MEATRTWRQLAFLASAGAAGIHLGAVREHREEWLAACVLMLAAGISQLAWAIWVARGAPRAVLWAGVAANAGLMLLWGVSRTAGLPAGPDSWMPEEVRGPDLVATILEFAVVMAAIALASGETPRAHPFLARCAWAGALAGVIATGHDPAREQLTVAATLGVALLSRAAPIQMFAGRTVRRGRDYVEGTIGSTARARIGADARAVGEPGR